MKQQVPHTTESCQASISAVKDTLYVLSGKWKLPLIIALINGPKRFKDLQRSLGNITPKVLSKELRDLELNQFVVRKVYDTVPVTVMYERTDYSFTLGNVIESMRAWGVEHKKKIRESLVVRD